MNASDLLTKETQDALYERIAKGVEENNFQQGADIIVYVMREAWMVGFEEGREHREQ